MNTVDVDTIGLNAEVDNVLRTAPPGPEALPPQPSEAELRQQQMLDEMQRAQATAQLIAPGVSVAAKGVFNFVAPNWKVTDAECAQLSESLATALALWFPNILNVPPKWLALGQVAIAIGAIVRARKDPETGALKPLREPPKEDQQQGMPLETAAA